MNTEHIVSDIINGNRSDAKIALKRTSKKKVLDVLEGLRSNGYNTAQAVNELRRLL